MSLLADAPLAAAAPPSEAVFDAEAEVWEVCGRNEEGARDGECRQYREDGSLKLRCWYSAGVLSGPFIAYHPDGTVARRGEFLDGKLHGVVTRFVSGAPGGEPLRSCCVPEGSTELRQRYRHGQLLREIFADGQGRPLTSGGRPWPERASGVPEDAEFDEHSDRWCCRLDGIPAEETSTFRYYDLDGRKVEEVEAHGGARRARRRFAASGELAEEHHFDEAGALAGRSYRLYPDATFADPRIVAEENWLEGGLSAGQARFLDLRGEVVRTVDRGAPLGDAELVASPALAERLEVSVESLAEAGRVREALCASARILARARERELFDRRLDEFVVRLTAECSAQRAAAAENREDSSSAALALEALLLGADPARMLRLLAAALPAQSTAALDLVEASLCLDPLSPRAHVTRAFTRLERGDLAGTLADAEVVAQSSEATAFSVREICRVLFPKFSFWPVREAIEPLPTAETIELDQPLSAVRWAIQLYATRLTAIRAALLARVKRNEATNGTEPAWLPPDLKALLPDGPIELREYAASITDETEEGSETTAVTIDERVEGLEQSGVPALMTRARGDWLALTWLCWAVGLDELGLPERIEPRPAFAAAADRATTRCFRAHDQLRSAGLVSRSRGVPGFVWEGIEIDDLAPTLCSIAATELVELRAMFFWLLFAQNLSPFQSDLRRA